MTKIFTIPTWQVFLILILPAFFPFTNSLGILVSILWGFFFAYSTYLLGNILYKKLPAGHDLNISRFHFALFFPLIYIIIVMLVFDGGYDINQDTYKNYGWVATVIIPFHFLAMGCIFYTIRFIGKSIATIENNKDVDFGVYAGNFFLLWFFPLGIWWMHPKIRKIVSGDKESLPTTSA